MVVFAGRKSSRRNNAREAYRPRRSSDGVSTEGETSEGDTFEWNGELLIIWYETHLLGFCAY